MSDQSTDHEYEAPEVEDVETAIDLVETNAGVPASTT